MKQTKEQFVGYTYDELLAENSKLMELASKMAKALGVGTDWCNVDCAREFGCSYIVECPIEDEMYELGIEVQE